MNGTDVPEFSKTDFVGVFVVVDHKAFPGTVEQASAEAAGYSGQLAAYASGLIGSLTHSAG